MPKPLASSKYKARQPQTRVNYQIKIRRNKTKQRLKDIDNIPTRMFSSPSTEELLHHFWPCFHRRFTSNRILRFSSPFATALPSFQVLPTTTSPTSSFHFWPCKARVPPHALTPDPSFIIQQSNRNIAPWSKLRRVLASNRHANNLYTISGMAATMVCNPVFLSFQCIILCHNGRSKWSAQQTALFHWEPPYFPYQIISAGVRGHRS